MKVSLESLVASNLTTGLLFISLVAKSTMNMTDMMTNAATVQARNGLMVLLLPPLLKHEKVLCLIISLKKHYDISLDVNM